MFMETNTHMTGPRFRHARNCHAHDGDGCTCGVEDSYREWAEGQAEDHQDRIEWEGDGR